MVDHGADDSILDFAVMQVDTDFVANFELSVGVLWGGHAGECTPGGCWFQVRAWDGVSQPAVSEFPVPRPFTNTIDDIPLARKVGRRCPEAIIVSIGVRSPSHLCPQIKAGDPHDRRTKARNPVCCHSA
jgi:hypothetical protein